MAERIKPKEMHQSMRGFFAGELYNHMVENDRIVVITADLGYGMFNKIQEAYPDRYINVGAAEQAAIGIASGMALKGKIPVVYSITNFLLYRPFEWLRNYVDKEQIPVKLFGSGRDDDYTHDGYTHQCRDAKIILAALPNIKPYFPETKEEMHEVMKEVLTSSDPTFVSLRR